MYVVVQEQAVYHYGLLSHGLIAMQPSWHYEGDTLSVSLSPTDWWAVFPNSVPGVELYGLHRVDKRPARFVDLARLSEANLLDIGTWATLGGYGSLRSPDVIALRAIHGVVAPADKARLALLLGWAKQKDVDGIWFTEKISAFAPNSGRGGIFQHRLTHFTATSLGPFNAATWPRARRPAVAMDCSS